MRTNRKTLEAIVGWINTAIGIPEGSQLWTTRDGKNHATIGMMYLDHNISGFQLERMSNDGGGVTIIIYRSPASSMENQLRAFHRGLTYSVNP
jgi:hypothetical protein